MNNNDEQQFDQLRKLLALKKHEVPPPGYFNRLPGKILARIEASEPASQSTWWDWLVARFDARPILACAYGFTMSGLLLMGFRFSQALQVADVETPAPTLGGGWLAATPDPVTLQPNSFMQSHFANPAGLVNFSSSIEPVVEMNPQRATVTSMFQPVSYTVGK
jgi:hypothetical protein